MSNPTELGSEDGAKLEALVDEATSDRISGLVYWIALFYGAFGILVAMNCPSSKHLGHMILFHMGGPGSSRFDVKPLVVDGSSGALGWSVS